MLENTVHIVDWLLAIPGFSGQYLFLARWQYLAVGLLLLPVILFAQPVMSSGRRYFVAICLLPALFFAVLPMLTAGGISLYMFSVGQGESLLLTNDAQQALLVDGGGLYSDRFDVGKRLLAPALGELGIHHLSAVLLTHDHPDHRKGLIFILRHFPVDEFWSGIAFAELHPQLQAVLREKAIPVRRFPAGWSEINSWSRTPLQLFRGPDRISKNDSSLVLYLPDPLGGLLLTGDLEKKGVGRLLAAGLPGPVSLLKLPHHGSRHSDTEHLIDRLQPQSCLVSAGYQNRYGLPARQLVNYLKQQCIPLYRTDIVGTIRVRKLADHWQIDTWQRGLFR
ncbi:MAG: MBL fold metallo-hydrolase [Deltaproteobacteria bacterium]|nr:MBL fold metallo-hydrolase [Deltaproteobacteria bacterium]